MKIELKKENRLLNWIKKYGAYCMAGLLVVAIALTVTLTNSGLNSTNSNISDVSNPIVDAGAEPVLTFVLPMMNASILKEFSSTELYENATFGWWDFHSGMDLTSDNLDVFAVADGRVTDVSYDYDHGHTVVITHSNNFVSHYCCLDEDSLMVEAGDFVKCGNKIGSAGNSLESEFADGNHLHFELFHNDEQVDPANYLNFENK